MCTLSYLLTDTGYELFFNRDEQHNRPIAIAPQFYRESQAIYPVDPQGLGTWLAVNKKGLSLALLNFYQACKHTSTTAFVSRGLLIPTLMQNMVLEGETKLSIEKLLHHIDLTQYQPFQLAVFPENLTKIINTVYFYQWDGEQLVLTNKTQPFTSSGVDFSYVEKQRKDKFKQLICPTKATREQFKAFHLSQETKGKYSVNMTRFDAKTVSISHLCVESEQGNKHINFAYLDNVNHQQYNTHF